ncbi:hypothetical protein SS50377_23904 [Spironucleus salmonicida]|uniref:LSM domain-containing protein n=1 Tax=Spironucleus salmonicida TaxID=348837 RepID=A0A9P8LTI5_9EUKA|nr:hypothetical protein SS50377_23900 [Spironucleus salmonicida]KAH0573969.1 hypothetical protein SS50377_23904 [Spironucleus salmonicida]
MPELKTPDAQAFGERFLGAVVQLQLTNGFHVRGALAALEYDLSFMLRDVTQFVPRDDAERPLPSPEAHAGYDLVQRKELLVPGRFVERVLLVE